MPNEPKPGTKPTHDEAQEVDEFAEDGSVQILGEARPDRIPSPAASLAEEPPQRSDKVTIQVDPYSFVDYSMTEANGEFMPPQAYKFDSRKSPQHPGGHELIIPNTEASLERHVNFEDIEDV